MATCVVRAIEALASAEPVDRTSGWLSRRCLSTREEVFETRATDDGPVPDEFAVGTAEVVTIPVDGGELEGDIRRSFEGDDGARAVSSGGPRPPPWPYALAPTCPATRRNCGTASDARAQPYSAFSGYGRRDAATRLNDSRCTPRERSGDRRARDLEGNCDLTNRTTLRLQGDARSMSGRAIRRGRPQRPPSASMRSRAVAIRSLVASRSIFAAHAMTAMITSACGPFRSKPSAALTTSTPCARSNVERRERVGDPGPSQPIKAEHVQPHAPQLSGTCVSEHAL